MDFVYYNQAQNGVFCKTSLHEIRNEAVEKAVIISSYRHALYEHPNQYVPESLTTMFFDFLPPLFN
jgi:hypothetical protein